MDAEELLRDVAERQVREDAVVGRRGKALPRDHDGVREIRAGKHRALGRPGRPRRVDEHRRLAEGALIDEALEAPGVRLPPKTLDLLVGDEPPVAVAAQALGIDVDDPLERGAVVGDAERFIHLLLVLGHDEARPGVREQVLDLGGRARRVDAHRRRADADRADLGEEPLRPVLRVDRDAIAGLEAERDEAEPERARAGVVVGPGVLAPDPEALLAQRDMGRALAAAPAERGGERVERGGHQPATAVSGSPRYARVTSGLRRISSGVPSAILRPKSSTITRSAMSSTTPMSWSTRICVTPSSSFTSSTKRAMSSVSSRFMPATGSSSSRSLGSMASARPSCTRFCRPKGRAPTG